MNCPGKREGHKGSCGDQTLVCKKCGNKGCAQTNNHECTKQAFRGPTCLKCGSYGFNEKA